MGISNIEAPAGPIPVIGLGTAEFRLGSSSERIRESVVQAIRVGYRHFDTAAIYNSEKPLGEAIADAISFGLIESRDDVFIATKLGPPDCHRDLVVPALKNSLENLKMEHVDLYLIHLPLSMKPGTTIFESGRDRNLLPMDFKSVWEAMEECKELGLTKHIGVSNFSSKKLDNLLATAKIPPLVNQVEVNPMWQQKKLREYCEKKGIYITAYSPLGGIGSPWGSNQVMECEVLKEIARAKGKSIAQICIRWVYEQGVSVVAKSFDKERMEQNLDIFGWSLAFEESEKIARIPQRKSYRAPEWVSENGPYKSFEEFWDEDIQ